MRKTRTGRLILYILLLLPALTAGCAGEDGALFPPEQNAYAMDLTLDMDAKTLSGTVTVDYANPCGAPLGELPFMVYPNAYRTAHNAPFFQEDLPFAYPQGFSPGGIDILSACVNGKSVPFCLSNPDETLLTLSLSAPLSPGERATVTFEILVTLPRCAGRFGYGEDALNLCNFYPIACVWGKDGFYTYPYYRAGDPFISHIARYDVRIAVPKGYTLAHTGEEYRRETDAPAGCDSVWIRAESVRDFAMVLSTRFAVARAEADGVSILSYYDPDCPEGGKAALRYAENAIRFLKNRDMPCPCKSLSIAQTEFFIGGMEYPGLMLVDQGLYRGGLNSSLEEVVAHETIHQYFYGAVGNDEVMEPWVDEALTTYLTLKYFGHVYGKDLENSMYRYTVKEPLAAARDLLGLDADALRVGAPMCDFSSTLAYSLAVYANGANLFYDLENALGEEMLFDALADYYRTFGGAIATGRCLMDSLNRSTQMNLNGIFKKWL